jgi:hypothetical protein
VLTTSRADSVLLPIALLVLSLGAGPAGAADEEETLPLKSGPVVIDLGATFFAQGEEFGTDVVVGLRAHFKY